MSGTHTERLIARLSEMGCKNFHVTLGPAAVSGEQVAEQVLKALDEMAAGGCEPVDFPPMSGRRKVDMADDEDLEASIVEDIKADADPERRPASDFMTPATVEKLRYRTAALAIDPRLRLIVLRLTAGHKYGVQSDAGTVVSYADDIFSATEAWRAAYFQLSGSREPPAS